MSALPFMTVFQVLARTMYACFKSLHHCSVDVLTRYLTHW